MSEVRLDFNLKIKLSFYLYYIGAGSTYEVKKESLLQYLKVCT